MENSTIAERTAKDKERVLEELCRVPIVQHACQKAGISRATYYRWKNEDPGFYNDSESALKSGIDTIGDLAESKLVENMRKGSMPAIIYWLRNNHERYKDRYTFQQRYMLAIAHAQEFRKDAYEVYKDNVLLNEESRGLRRLEKDWKIKELKFEKEILRLKTQFRKTDT